MLSVLRMYRENLVHIRDPYIHAIATTTLYNLAEHSFNLHDIASLQLLKLIKAVYNKYVKVTDQNEKEETRQVFNSLIEVLTKMMRGTISNNASLTYIIMHHARLFERISEDESLNCTNVELFLELIEYLGKSIDAEDVYASVTTQVKMFAPKKVPNYTLFKGVLGFNYKEDESMESFMIPFIWRTCGQPIRKLDTSLML